MILRKYTTQDAVFILEIINYNILNSTSLYDYDIRTIEQQIAILNEKQSKGFPIFVAEIDGVFAGFAMYSEFRFKQAYLHTVEHSVYVSKDFIGRGIGKALMGKLIEHAKKDNIHTMIAVIDSENELSIDFHKQFGFEYSGMLKETGFKFNRWLNNVFMQLILN